MTRQSLDALLLVLLGVFLASPSLAARSGSWPTCEIAKYEATQRMLACRLDKFAASERTGRSTDYTRCTRRFERQLARVKSGFGSDCITADTSSELLASAEVQEADLKASLGDASTPRARKCVAKKAKIQASVLRCHRKQDRKLDRGRKTNYARCEDKARSRLARAESRFDGSCPVGDSHAGVVSAVFAGQTNLYAVAAGIEGKPFCSRSLVTTDLIKRYVTDYTSTTSQNFLASQIWGEVLFGASGLLSRAGGLSETQIKKLQSSFHAKKNPPHSSQKENQAFASGFGWPHNVEARNATSGNATIGVRPGSLLPQASAFAAIAKYCTADPAEIEEYLVTDYRDFDFQSDPQPFMAALMQDLVSGESVPPAGTHKFPEDITSSLSLSDQKILKTFANAGPLGMYATMASPASKSIGNPYHALCQGPKGGETCTNAPFSSTARCETDLDCAEVKDGIHGTSGHGWGLHMYLYASADQWKDRDKQHGPNGFPIFQMYWNSALDDSDDPCHGNPSFLASPDPDATNPNQCQENPNPSNQCSGQPGWRIASDRSTGESSFDAFHYWSDAGMRFSLFEGSPEGDAKQSADSAIMLSSEFMQGAPLEVIVKYNATSEDEKLPQEDFIDVREKFPGFLKEVLANKKGTYTPSDGFWQGIVVDLGGTGHASSCLDGEQFHLRDPYQLETGWTSGFSAVIPLAGGISADEFAKKLQVAAREGQSNPKARRDRRRLARGSMSPAGEAWTTRATEAATTPATCSKKKGYSYLAENIEVLKSKKPVQTTYSPYAKLANPFEYHFGDPVEDPHKIWATIRSLFKKRVQQLLGVYAETFANRSTIEVGGHTFTNHPKITAGPGNLFASTVKIDGVAPDGWTTKQFVLADIMRQLANEWIENVWVSGPSWLERESSAITPTAGEKTPKELPFWLGGGCNHPPAKATKSGPPPPTTPCSLLAGGLMISMAPYSYGTPAPWAGFGHMFPGKWGFQGSLSLHANNNQRSDGQEPLNVPMLQELPSKALAAYTTPFLEPKDPSVPSQFWPCAPQEGADIASCQAGKTYPFAGTCASSCEPTDRKGVLALPDDLFGTLIPMLQMALYVSTVEAIVKMAPEVQELEDAMNAHKNLLYLAKIPKFQTTQFEYRLTPAGKSWLPPAGPVVGYTGCLASYPGCGAQPAQMKRLALKYHLPTCNSNFPLKNCETWLAGCKLDGTNLPFAVGGWACAPFLAGFGGFPHSQYDNFPAPLTSLELLGLYLTPNPREDGFAKHPPQVTKNYNDCMCPYLPKQFFVSKGAPPPSCRALQPTWTTGMVPACSATEVKPTATASLPVFGAADQPGCATATKGSASRACSNGICLDGPRSGGPCIEDPSAPGTSSACGTVQCAGCVAGNKQENKLNIADVAVKVQTMLGCQMGSDFTCADPKNSPDSGPNDLFLSPTMLSQAVNAASSPCTFNGQCYSTGASPSRIFDSLSEPQHIIPCTKESLTAYPASCDGYVAGRKTMLKGKKETQCWVPTAEKGKPPLKLNGPCLPSPSETTGPGV